VPSKTAMPKLLDSYKEYLKENSNSPVSMQIAELEAKVAAAPGAKK
jgi:hypothetical protein